MHYSHENDGTIAITSQVNRPMQGTFIGEEKSGKLVVAKGIVRPPLQNEHGVRECSSVVKEAAFGKDLAEAASGEFFTIREVGKEKCSMAYQTILFSTKDPAAIILDDTRRVEGMTALDLLSSEARKKVTAGIPLSLLIQDMAPWDMLRRFEVPGVRATVYGSDLVPRGDAEDELEASITKAFSEMGITFDPEWNESWFMSLPGTAESLAEQLDTDVSGIMGRWFLVHRDPALPDGTSLFPAKFGGVLDWVKPSDHTHGIALHPQDPNWNAAGGDFDGDSAALYVPSEILLPRGAVPRLNYKVDTRTFVSHSVADQIAEAAANDTTQLLGPVILNAMRLAEREIDDSDLRTLAASAAQASVQAKKHAVDTEATNAAADIIANAAWEATEDRTFPYISDAMNQLRHGRGLEEKKQLWIALMGLVEGGMWDNGSSIERALVSRLHAVNALFKDTTFFQLQQRNAMPQSIRAAAAALTPPKLADLVIPLTEEMRELATKLASADEIDDEELRNEYMLMLRNDMAIAKAKFYLAASTGKFPGHTATVEDAQHAIIAFGPARMAVQYCPSERFLALGKRSKRIITALKDKDWENGVINVADLRPIPACETDVAVFIQDLEKCDLQIISASPRSTRVCLSSL